MSNDVEVFRRAIELSETIGEALRYAEMKLVCNEAESALMMLQEAVWGFNTVEHSLEPYFGMYPFKDIEEYVDKIIQSFDDMFKAYNERNVMKMISIMKYRLLPSYNKWQDELIRVLKSYTLN